MITISEKPIILPLGVYLWGTKEETEKGRVVLSRSGTVLKVSFKVEAKELRREVLENNGNVYEDSCAEIFLKKTDSKEYYNFEFSASGAMLIGKGENRNERVRLTEPYFNKVKRKVTVIENTNLRAIWTLDIELDLADFDLVSSTLMGNIYLCGDKLKEVVFISLFDIDILQPDFHRPDFFGEFNLL